MKNPLPFPVLNSEIHSIRSNDNELDYQISIVKPYTYHEKVDQNYPCLLVLDSLAHQVLVAGIANHLYFSDFPEFLIAGIGPKSLTKIDKFSSYLPEVFSYRQRDYTPTIDLSQAEAVKEWLGEDLEQGGAKDFLFFLKNDVIPFVQENYRIEEDDLSIMGHSLGGLFVLYTLFNESRMFRGYVATSPALDHGNRSMFQTEEDYAKNNHDLKADLYLSVGLEEEEMDDPMTTNLIRFSEILKSRDYKSLNIKKKIFEDVDHNEVVPFSSLDGLKFLYKN